MGTNQWYKSWFNTQDYLNLYKHRDSNDAKRVISLLFRHVKLNRDARILDLACGNGRHSMLFASKGYNTLGVDLSPFLIKQARMFSKQGNAKFSKRLRFEIGDMRNIGHKEEFDLVVNLFSSFGYFDKEKENEKVIESVSGSLKKGGYFFFDFFNSRYLKKHLVPFSFEKRKNEILIQLRSIKGKICKKDILIFENSKNKTGIGKYKHYTELVRLFDETNLREMFVKNNLKILKEFGDYIGAKFNKTSSGRLIILAQKV
jgi:SAM-dependent methyltransferase